MLTFPCGINRALSFATIHEQPFQLPNSYDIGDLVCFASAAQTHYLSQGVVVHYDSAVHVENSADAVVSLETSETPKLLFGPLKQNMRGGRFHNNREMGKALNKWFRLQELKSTQVEFLNYGPECARGLC